MTVLGLADLLHVRFYADVFSSTSFTTMKMVRDVAPSLIPIVRGQDPMFVADLALWLILLPLYFLAVRRIPRLARPTRRRLGASLFVGGLLLGAPTARLAWEPEHGLFATANVRLEAAAVVGLLPYHLLDAVDTVIFRHTIGEIERQQVRQFLTNDREQLGEPSPLFGAAQGRNLILVSLESLQSFPIGLEVDGQPVAPNLAALVGESLFFKNFHEQTYLGTTSDAQFMVLNGLHPQSAGFVAYTAGDRHLRALPSILAERGYTTLAAVAAEHDFWNADKTHPAYGIAHTLFEPEYSIGERIGPWMADRDFFAQTVPAIERLPEPFMAYLFTSSNHHPFALPAHEQTLQIGALEGTLLGAYLQSVHYADAALGELLGRLREHGILDRSVLVMYGDHQGFLGDPPELAGLLGLPDWDEYQRTRVRKRVPLFIRLPHGEQAGVRSEYGGEVDVAPTILSLLGIEDDTQAMLGHDLTRSHDPLVVFRDGSFTDGQFYWVQRFGATLSAACYQADTGQSVDCATLEQQRRAARERLRISDLIVQGDLVPELRQHGR
ncbi:MAG: LTA synthase family protein [Chloroflexi bacterium]|nr:LTA synthase family protein [Chloroflexota bacterium]